MENGRTTLKRVNDLIMSLVAGQPGITLSKLLEASESITADDIHRLIVRNKIYVDLSGPPLAEPWRVHAFASEDVAHAFSLVSMNAVTPLSELKHLTLEVGVKVQFDGVPMEISVIGETAIFLRDSNGTLTPVPNADVERFVHEGKLFCVSDSPSTIQDTITDLMARASPDDHAVALRRTRHLDAKRDGQVVPDDPVSDRSLRRWEAKVKAAEVAYGEGNGYLGALGRASQSGNWERKIEKDDIDLMGEVIDKHYFIPAPPKKKVVYGIYLKRCEQIGKKDEISSKTFYMEIENLRPKHQRVAATQGEKAAYPFVPFILLDQYTPRHGDYPFQIAHLDHTKLDIELVSYHGVSLGRPWLTLLTDAYSRRVLAYYVTFDPPSYRSCMMVIRMCVERYNRLPRIFIVDAGSDFEGTYFESILARFKCHKKTRPKSKPRFGAPIERLFGITNTQFVHTLSGNTQNTKIARLITPAINPKALAVWQLADFAESLDEYFFERYDTRKHGVLGLSPRDAFQNGIYLTGSRPSTLIAYSEAFKLQTLPPTPRETVTVIPGRGVNARAIYYWNDLFDLPRLEKQKLFAKEDPFNAGSVYAYVDRKWNLCLSEFNSLFKDMSVREIQMLSQILRRQRQQSGMDFKIDAKMIAECYLENAEKQEILLQRMKDDERKRSLTVLEGGKSSNVPLLTLDSQGSTEPRLRDLSSKNLKPCRVVS